MLSTKAKVTKKDDNLLGVKKKLKLLSDPDEKEILKYFSAPERLAALKYPDTIMKRSKKKKIEHLYVGDEETAQKIANILTDNLPRDLQLIEVNPGVGMLTKHLAQTENKLFLYENNDSLHNQLKKVYEKDPKITLKNENFIQLWKLCYMDRIDSGNRVEELYAGVQRKQYEDDVTARVFACVGTVSMLKDLINSVIFQTSFLSIGRQEFYICMPPAAYIVILFKLTLH
jgi:dimethyladenosine transferase 2, mitochondrial